MSNPGTPGSAPKSMSSRLLTMKFMQRAAASSPTASSPSTPDEPSPKRRRKDSNSPSSLAFDVNALADQRAIQAALAEEEGRRQVALERAAAEAGDTRWVLSFEDQRAAESPKLTLRVVQTGYANLDATPNPNPVEQDEDLEEKPVMIGRRSFGKFNKVLEKQEDGEEESESDSDSDENEISGEDSDGDDPMSALISSSRQEAAQRAKEDRKAKKRAEKAQSEEFAKKRKKKEVKLNGLTSLSGRSKPFTGACYNCGGPHQKSECPRIKRGFQGGDDGPPRKTIKTR